MAIRRTDDHSRCNQYSFARKDKGIDGAWDYRKGDSTNQGMTMRKQRPATPPLPKPIEVKAAAPALTGGKSDHYQVQMMVHCGDGKPDIEVQFDCNDLIEELEMNFAEGEVFKAVWRKAAARLGKGKPGHQPLYDAQKVEFFGKRMVIKHSKKA